MVAAAKSLTIVLLLFVADIAAMTTTRSLGNNGDYMEDNEGNKYATYAVSWRYLGMYIDCDIETGVNRRRLKNQSDCVRKVMWASYYDPDYQGFSIGEYQFYDWTSDTWDTSTCQTDRCATMDCHLPETRYQLIGVFTETDGLEDWAEQLFKHQGYCLWDGDKQENGGKNENGEYGDYAFMQNNRKTWSKGCQKGDVSDANGSSVYIGVKPLPYGQMTFSVYSDEDCTVEADMTIKAYMMSYYINKKNYSVTEAEEYVASYLLSIKRWNNLMHDFRTCQPCRAYNKVQTQRSRRELNNDGDGDSEMWGYDCYDAAGYTNCNQCYKFGSKTDMESATLDDLRRATVQGSIMEVQVDGIMYGGFIEPPGFQAFSLHNPQIILFFVALILVWAIFLGAARNLIYNRIVRCCHKLHAPVNLKEKLNDEDSTKEDTATEVARSDCQSTVTSEAYQRAAEEWLEGIVEKPKKEQAKSLIGTMDACISERDGEIKHLLFRLDMERTKHDLARQRMAEQLETLQTKLADLAQKE